MEHYIAGQKTNCGDGKYMMVNTPISIAMTILTIKHYKGHSIPQRKQTLQGYEIRSCKN
jgi:hypothetical protein